MPLEDGQFVRQLHVQGSEWEAEVAFGVTPGIFGFAGFLMATSVNVRLRYNCRPESDLYIIYNVGTQFASIAQANPPQVRETRLAVKYTYSFAP